MGHDQGPTSRAQPLSVILPSAHRGCSRPSGSGSWRDCCSTGISSIVPMLPSTMAELRFRPRSFARFIGDRLNAVVNFSCDMARISRASVRASSPAITSLAANGEPSAGSLANLMLYGQTSWEDCRYNHFEIPLGTGNRTLKKMG